MPSIEQTMVAPQPSAVEKKEAKASDAVAGFEEHMLVLQRALAENEELAKKDPEKAAAQQKDLEMHAAGLWLNVRIAQASRMRLGDTPQEVSKNSDHLNEIAEKLGSQPIDAYVYYLEKMLPEFSAAFGVIGKNLLDKKITSLQMAEERKELSERLSDFIDRKVFLVEEMLNSRDLKKIPREEKDAYSARVQAVKEKALKMCRESDAPTETQQEKVEKK